MYSEKMRSRYRRGQILLEYLRAVSAGSELRLQALFSAACVTSVDSLVQRALDAVPRATRIKNANMLIREAQCSVKVCEFGKYSDGSDCKETMI